MGAWVLWVSLFCSQLAQPQPVGWRSLLSSWAVLAALKTPSHTHRHVFYTFSRHLSNVVRLTVTTLIITKHTIRSIMETSIRQILYVHTQGIISCTTEKASSPSLTVDSKDAHSTLTLICIDDWQVLSLQSSASDILAHDKKGQQPWFSSICTEKSLTHKHDGHS